MKSPMPAIAIVHGGPRSAFRAESRGVLPRLPKLRGHKCADGRKAYPEDFSHG
jgi:hypothetical protein